MDIFRKIFLLLWKNLLLRRRHYIVSTLEVIFPILFLCGLPAQRAITAPDDVIVRRDGTVNPKLFISRIVLVNDTIYPIQFEEDLILNASTRLLGPESRILFAPNTTLATEIMNRVMTNLGSNQSQMLGLNSETEIIQRLKDHNKQADEKFPDWRRELSYPFGGIVVFQEPFNWNSSSPPLGAKVSYKIRIVHFGYSPHTTNNASADEESIKTKLKVLTRSDIDQISRYDEYKVSGFSGLQIAVDRAVIWIFANKTGPTLKIQTQHMPYPSYNYTDENINGLLESRERVILDATVLSFSIVLGFILVIPSVLRNVIAEKETGIKELMKMMGLPSWMHWLGWMMNSLILFLITMAIVTILIFAPLSENGGVLINADFSLWFIIHILFLMATAAFGFFISSFFQKPVLALTAGVIICLTTLAMMMLIHFLYKIFKLPHKIALTLMPNIALQFANRIFFVRELTGGANWTNLFEPLSSTDDLTLGYVLFMLIVDIILFITLTIYLENIIPSEYGLRKPWYYPLQISKCLKISTGRVTPEIVDDEHGPEHRPGFEPEPSDLHAGVVIDNLRKEFGRHKVAVNMVGTLKMYDGQITALLGHNGAGKTTALSILTGLFAPTSGTATVNGYDIRNNMDEVRQNLGLCPQHNMVFPKLTFQEHLIFFGILKGLTKNEAVQESNNLLRRMNILEKMNVLAEDLSGGQKRRLCLGMALIGGTKVVILDEPTSGMDPEARRAIWDLLLGMRGERTIILTTHFMEEADVLGDRIAIMADGQVKCCGTPAFLRKYYGAGYTLKLTVADPSVRPNILVLVQKHFPQASFKTSQSGNATQVDITIPIEPNTNSEFPDFFSSLAGEQQQLGIQTVGLSLATMDDIFVKVGQEAGVAENEFVVNDNLIAESGTEVNKQRVKGVGLVLQQFYAIFIKRMLASWRNRKLFLTQLFLPVGFLILSILLGGTEMSSSSDPEVHTESDQFETSPMTIEWSRFQNPVIMLQASAPELDRAYEEVVGNSSVSDTNNLSLALLNAGKRDLDAYLTRYVVAGNISDTNATALFSALPKHGSPLSVNLMSNAILRLMTPPNTNYKIEVTVHPIYFPPKGDRSRAPPGVGTSHATAILFGILITIGFSLLLASFVVPPTEEKLCHAKQLQLMTGVKPSVYWAASFLWDYCSIFILICVMLICYAIFDRKGVYNANNGAGVIFLILVTFGFAGISFSYFYSATAKTVAGAFSYVVIVHIQYGVMMSLIVYFSEIIGQPQWPILYFVARSGPTFGGAISIMRFTHIAIKNAQCGTLDEASLRAVCNSSFPFQPSSYSLNYCCPDCQPYFPLENDGGVEIQCSPEPYLRWQTPVQFDKNGTITNDTIPGISQEIFYMVIFGLVYVALFLSIEDGLLKRLMSKAVKADPAIFAQTDSSVDEDVQVEKDRVTQLVRTGQHITIYRLTQGMTADDALVVDNLCKSYGTFAAVSGLTFGVHHGECFGLLGVNGAGKTTALRMLTGDEIRSFGTAYNMRLSLDQNRDQFLSRIGYCPQSDGIIGVLTGKEMVALFARLRGIPWANVDEESNKWLSNVGLLNSANVQFRKYSGGMKRRLSAAIALVGDPPVVLLDEPTSGVDPVARRHFWKVIDYVCKSGQAVVLTSHSMEECEALCSRLGIMVNGQFQCLGGVQHLKAKFAQGFKLVVTLNKAFPEQQQTQLQQPVQTTKDETQEGEGGNDEEGHTREPLPEHVRTATDEERISLLCNEILKTFNPCSLKERHQRILEFQVTGKDFEWGQMFGKMEEVRRKFEELIEDYAITETTLEEVFLSFARLQYPEREVKAPCWKRCFNC